MEGLNRRKSPRVVVPCLIKIAWEGEAPETLLTHTENVSGGGVLAILRRQLDISSSIVLEVDLMDGEPTIICYGRVAWTNRRKATEEKQPFCYDTGIEFVDLKAGDRARLEKMVERRDKASKPSLGE